MSEPHLDYVYSNLKKETVAHDLWMKTGTEHALLRGERILLNPDSAAVRPFVRGGELYVPLAPVAAFAKATVRAKGKTAELLSAAGKTTVDVLNENGALFATRESLAAALDLYDYAEEDMGLFAFSEKPLDYDDSYSSLAVQTDIIAAFVYDFPTPERLFADAQRAGCPGVHPRLFGRQKRFDRLRHVWQNGEEDPRLHRYIAEEMRKADEFFDKYFVVGKDGKPEWKDRDAYLSTRDPYYCYDENENPIVKRDSVGRVLPVTSYTSPDGSYTDSCENGDGVDVGIRLNEAPRTAASLRSFAFAWQMTGDGRYVDAFCIIALRLAVWPTWGEGHFLNCADTCSPYATGLDWIWHALDDRKEERDRMLEALYRLGVMRGYYTSKSVYEKLGDAVYPHLAVSTRAGDCDRFYHRNNNWNTVCTSGITLAALTLFDIPEYREKSLYTVSELFTTLPLSFLPYAPDGSYSEGAGYWGYGTNTLYRMCAALWETLGDDYGFMDIGGLDKSCYFAFYIANGSGTQWNFHDGNCAGMDYSFFYFNAKYYHNPDYAYLRDRLADAGSKTWLEDVLYYDASMTDGAKVPALDHLMKGSNTATMRSGWDKDATYAGLHAGANLMPHSDMDSGNFIIEMGGTRWFSDYGSENYNVGGYWSDDTRYRYYRKSPEGHSTVSIRSEELPYGQVRNHAADPCAKIVRTVSLSDRALAVADMTPQFGPTCTSAKRALMLFDERKKVLVRDEITFSSPTSLAWTGILRVDAMVPTVTDDGRTVLIHYGDKTLRVTMHTPDPVLRFVILPSGSDPFLPAVMSKNSPANLREDGSYRYPLLSDTGTRLAVFADQVTEFTFAVTVEMISSDDTPATAYDDSAIDDLLRDMR